MLMTGKIHIPEKLYYLNNCPYYCEKREMFNVGMRESDLFPCDFEVMAIVSAALKRSSRITAQCPPSRHT